MPELARYPQLGTFLHGSELYRGLGAVVVGGLICSTIFTLVVVPLLFSLVLDCQAALRRVLPGQCPKPS